MAAMALSWDRTGYFILVLTGYAKFFSYVFGGDAHVVVVEGIPQAVFDHYVGQLAVTHTQAPSSFAAGYEGALDMLSIPPATTISLSPARMDWAANSTHFRPEPQTLLTVKAGTSWGTPP